MPITIPMTGKGQTGKPDCSKGFIPFAIGTISPIT